MASNYFNKKRGVSPNDQANFDMYSQEDQDALSGNTKPKSGGFQVNYGAIGSSAAQGGANIYSTYRDPNSTEIDKYNATQSGIGNTIGSINPVIGGIMGIGNMIGGPIKSNSEQFDENGQLLNENKARRNAIIGSIASPSKAFAYRQASGNWGDITGKGYTKWLEEQEQSRLDGLKPDEIPYENIQRMTFGGMKFPNGGFNSEVELEENSIAPDGEFTQYNGPSHANGGIKTNLENNEIVFSDRLKLGKKTFAELNKVNNTKKEDKILEDKNSNSLSKKTAELMRMAKLKNSQELFNQQEQLKQEKVLNYAKKMGLNIPESTPNNDQFKNHGMFPYGGINKYPDGGRNLTYPQKLQAYSDSLTLYNSGNRPGQPNWRWPGANQAFLRLQTLNGQEPQPVGKTAFTDNGNYTGESSQFRKPIKPTPYVEPIVKPTIKNSIVNKPQDTLTKQPVQVTQPLTPPTQAIQPQVKNYSTRQWDFSNPAYKTLLYKDQSGNIINTEQYDYNNQKVTPIKESFATGGRKKDPNDINNMTAQDQRDYQAWFNANSMDEGFDSSPQASMNQYNSSLPRTSINTPSNFNTQYETNNNWVNQLGLGIANNAGNIYDFARSNKPEVTKYQRVRANTVDPSAALRDIDSQNRAAEYNIRSISGGNAGSYLANRVALATNAALNKDRARQQYANTNAQILNQNASENAQIQRAENDANEMNRAQNRNIRGQALANTGSNLVNQYRDNKADQYDETTLNNLNQLYSALDKDPVLKAKWQKLRKGYK